MEMHQRTLGILHIVYGSIGLLIFSLINAIVRTALPFIIEEAIQPDDQMTVAIFNMVLDVLRWVFVIIMLLGPIPSIIGGIATIYRRSWGLPTLLVSGCLSLLNVPFGTALGIYTIWVFLEEQKLNKT